MSAVVSLPTRGDADAPRSMRARFFNVYRIASYALVLYALGHTMGAVVNTPALGPESDAVAATMKSVHIAAQGADCTWYGFYRGFGVFVSIFFIFSAVLTWYVGGRSAEDRRVLAPITWALFASYAASIVSASVWFFPAPIVFSTVVAALLGFACIRDWRVENADQSR
jgi:hypothetical protein